MREDTLHCHVGNLSRRKLGGGEHSAVARAAYVSGTALWNAREQKTTRFDGRIDVVFSELVAPEGAPAWARDRESLWNTVEAFARRRDARLAKTIEVSLPRVVPAADWPTMVRAFVAPYTAAGMVADAAIHEDGTLHNPHVHVLLTVQVLKPEGFGQKIANADHKSFVTQARTGWETICNAFLAKNGSALRLDRRSFRARGLSTLPTLHRGPDPAERRARRAYARILQKERTMSDGPSAADRHAYPLLTQRPDWPPVEKEPLPEMSTMERVELERFWQQREAAAQEAAHADFFAHNIPSWWAQQQERSLEPEAAGRADAQPWYEQAVAAARKEAAVETVSYRQTSLDDFEQSETFVAFREARLAYEQDLWRRAINLPRTRGEDDLMRRAAAHSPDMRKLMENQLFERRLMRLRQEDDARTLEAFEARLGPALREPFEDHVRPNATQQPLPVPGPYGELSHPRELAREQDRMVEAYERDEQDPERER